MTLLARAKRVSRYVVGRRGYAVMRDSVVRSGWFKRRLVASYLGAQGITKLHIGCQDHQLSGWLNTELGSGTPVGVLHLDATQPFPLPTASFDYIFSEHMIEHVPVAGAVKMLAECFRILKPGGRIRIATPPLEFFLELMTNPGPEHLRYADYHYEEFLSDSPLKLPAAILNDYYRAWGHQFVYDEASLRRLLGDAGFVDIQLFPINESGDEHLRGLENDSRMPEGLLALTTMCLEAEKPRPR